jgi:hypothetical protein
MLCKHLTILHIYNLSLMQGRHKEESKEVKEKKAATQRKLKRKWREQQRESEEKEVKEAQTATQQQLKQRESVVSRQQQRRVINRLASHEKEKAEQEADKEKEADEEIRQPE